VAVDDLHDDIELPDGIPVSIGRSASTNISDTQVSRVHGMTAVSVIVVCCYAMTAVYLVCINFCKILLLLSIVEPLGFTCSLPIMFFVLYIM